MESQLNKAIGNPTNNDGSEPHKLFEAKSRGGCSSCIQIKASNTESGNLLTVGSPPWPLFEPNASFTVLVARGSHYRKS